MTDVENKSPGPTIVDTQNNPDHSNNSSNAEAETSQYPPQGPSGQPFPPPNFAFYAFPPSQQPPSGEGGNSDPNAASNGNGSGSVPYPPPPGMLYPYGYPQPPPGYMPVPMSGMPLPGALIKPKRKQVKMACTNCAAACKRCDVARPCERCVKYGLSDSCRDGQRKERKKGFKRGPYNKRKRQEEREAHEWEAAQNNPNGEWTPNGPNGSPFPGPPQQGQFPPPPEGYYPAFYALAPPPSGPGPQLVPVNQSGSPSDNPVESQVEGAVDSNANGQHSDNSGQQGQPSFPPPHAQFVYPPLAPGSYPPFGYPFPGPPQHQHSQSQQEPEPTSSNAKKRHIIEDDDKDEDEEDPPTPPRKKRARRNSDGEWPAPAKRVSKTAKVDNTTPTRRSARKHHHAQDEGHLGAGGDVHDETVTETILSVPERNITSHNVGDHVIQGKTA